MPDYYIPRTRKDLIEWIEKYISPDVRIRKMGKKQLYAVFFRLRNNMMDTLTHTH